jgi:hypothetical protein
VRIRGSEQGCTRAQMLVLFRDDRSRESAREGGESKQERERERIAQVNLRRGPLARAERSRARARERERYRGRHTEKKRIAQVLAPPIFNAVLLHVQKGRRRERTERERKRGTCIRAGAGSRHLRRGPSARAQLRRPRDVAGAPLRRRPLPPAPPPPSERADFVCRIHVPCAADPHPPTTPAHRPPHPHRTRIDRCSFIRFFISLVAVDAFIH